MFCVVQASFEKVRGLLSHIKSSGPEHAVIMIVGNKCDRDDKVVQYNTAKVKINSEQ